MCVRAFNISVGHTYNNNSERLCGRLTAAAAAAAATPAAASAWPSSVLDLGCTPQGPKVADDVHRERLVNECVHQMMPTIAECQVRHPRNVTTTQRVSVMQARGYQLAFVCIQRSCQEAISVRGSTSTRGAERRESGHISDLVYIFNYTVLAQK
jgi:hypothetical protein